MAVNSSERRHRLNAIEVVPVMKAVEFKLKQLVKEKSDLLMASILFRVHFRLKEYVTSRPNYPPHETWEDMSSYLWYGTVTRTVG